ncbi:hypothetical protein PENSPDRAFT_686966 [Peniophora sp. CONT]|nr:hypothetical protein PENSPDRAFT_686966 [Peniophora sp. CONT]
MSNCYNYALFNLRSSLVSFALTPIISGMGFARNVEVADSFVGKLQLSAAPLLFQTGLFGAHTLLMVMSVYILSGKGLSVVRRTVLLAFILAIYACSATHWAIALFAFQKLIGHPIEELGSSPAATITGVMAVGINVTLSDAIVLWRAHVIWGHSRIVILVSLFFLVMTKYRQEFMRYLRNYRQGRSERVLMLLVESGVLYCIFWVGLLALAWIGIDTAQTDDKTSGPLVAQSIIFASMAQLCGIYPTIVIVAVCFQGVAYNPDVLTGQVPGLDLENGHISTELEFARGTQTTMRRSIAVSVGLPTLSVGPDSEHSRQQESGEEDKMSAASVP